MGSDTFYNQTHCDRCQKPLAVRTMSWFTEETICGECMDKEKVIKHALREIGIANAMEGCGFVPDPEKEKSK